MHFFLGGGVRLKAELRLVSVSSIRISQCLLFCLGLRAKKQNKTKQQKQNKEKKHYKSKNSKYNNNNNNKKQKQNKRKTKQNKNKQLNKTSLGFPVNRPMVTFAPTQLSLQYRPS